MNNVNPIHYRIRLEPDLDKFKFRGLIEILIKAVESVREISLNMLELAIWSCKARLKDEFVDCPFLIDHKKRGDTCLSSRGNDRTYNSKNRLHGRT